MMTQGHYHPVCIKCGILMEGVIVTFDEEKTDSEIALALNGYECESCVNLTLIQE